MLDVDRELDAYHYNMLLYILESLTENKHITKEQWQSEEAMFKQYKKTNDFEGFMNNEGYSTRYDCCLRLIMRFFDIIWEDESIV